MAVKLQTKKSKIPVPFQKNDNGQRFLRKNRILLATVGRLLAILADFDVFFRHGTNFVSIGSSFIFFFCVGGRFLQLKQSLNSLSSNGYPRSSLTIGTEFMSVVGQSTFTYTLYAFGFLLNVGRRY